ncbi:MAG: hypothetical protein M1299_12300 [Firmicutes bacterium]|nr:hypothetical protein [Bacillota bacterium]MCL5040578.1 hypothetical protein [Bacillota bacterium]
MERDEVIYIIADDKDKVVAGGAPILIAPEEVERERLALYLSRILNAMVHDLENGVLILVKH